MPQVRALTAFRVLVEAFPGLQIAVVPVDTPAGGIVRVAAMGGGGEPTVCFDDAYTTGTAVCTLETKFKWKLGDPKTRGPPPFKASREVGLWETRAAKMVADVSAAIGVAPVAHPLAAKFSEEAALLNDVLAKNKGKGYENWGTGGLPACKDLSAHLVKVLSAAEQAAAIVAPPAAVWAFAKQIEISDTKMVEDIKAKLGAKA